MCGVGDVVWVMWLEVVTSEKMVELEQTEDPTVVTNWGVSVSWGRLEELVALQIPRHIKDGIGRGVEDEVRERGVEDEV